LDIWFFKISKVCYSHFLVAFLADVVVAGFAWAVLSCAGEFVSLGDALLVSLAVVFGDEIAGTFASPVFFGSADFYSSPDFFNSPDFFKSLVGLATFNVFPFASLFSSALAVVAFGFTVLASFFSSGLASAFLSSGLASALASTLASALASTLISPYEGFPPFFVTGFGETVLSPPSAGFTSSFFSSTLA